MWHDVFFLVLPLVLPSLCYLLFEHVSQYSPTPRSFLPPYLSLSLSLICIVSCFVPSPYLLYVFLEKI